MFELNTKNIESYSFQILSKDFIENNYIGRFFMAGGVFKKLINPNLNPKDIDIFPSSIIEEEKLKKFFYKYGKFIKETDYNFLFKLSGSYYEVKKLYKKKKYSSTLDVIKKFDIGISGIGVEYKNKDIKATILDEAIISFKNKELNLISTYENWEYVLATIERFIRYEKILGFKFPVLLEEKLWDVYYNLNIKEEMLERYKETSNDEDIYREIYEKATKFI